MVGEGLIPFQMKPGETLNPNGRPKNTLTELKGQGLSRTDCYNAIGYMLKMDKPELTSISKSESEPVWKVCIARAILRDIARGFYSTVESLFDRLFGRSHQPIDAEVTVTQRFFDE